MAGIFAPQTAGTMTLLSVLQRAIADKMPGAQVRIEGNSIIIFLPFDRVLDLVKSSMPEPYKSVIQIRMVANGIEMRMPLR